MCRFPLQSWIPLDDKLVMVVKRTLVTEFADGHIRTVQALVPEFVVFERHKSQAALAGKLLRRDGILLGLNAIFPLVLGIFQSLLDLLVSVLLCFESELFQNVVSPGDSAKWTCYFLPVLDFVAHPSFHALSVYVSAASLSAEGEVFFLVHGVIADAASLIRLQFYPSDSSSFHDLSFLRSLSFLLGLFLQQMGSRLPLTSMTIDSISAHLSCQSAVSLLQNLRHLRIEIAQLPNERICLADFENLQQGEYSMYAMLDMPTSTAAFYR